MQPLVKYGKTIRFRGNSIVQRMLDECQAHGVGLNEILSVEYDQREVDQFYQLLGYSLDMYEELSLVSNKSVAAAKRRARRLNLGKEYRIVELAREWAGLLAKSYQDNNQTLSMTIVEAMDRADDALIILQNQGRIRGATTFKCKTFVNEFVRALRRRHCILDKTEPPKFQGVDHG